MAVIFDRLFQLMADREASDIYVTAGAPISIKINGQMVPINQQIMEPVGIQKMGYELVTPEQGIAFERDRELNFSVQRPGLGNFRVNFFWQRNSMAIVVRYIRTEIPSIYSLGVPEVLGDIIMEKRGLVLVVGATGSGKSTTIAAMLDHRNINSAGHILTVEDPIEFLFRHKKSIVNQREVGFDTKSWNDALKNALRQAPDCILIGEIRDLETMKAAIAYSQSGHLVVATLHANNSYHAMNRIAGFFPLESRSLLYLDLSASLKTVISQRLVRTKEGNRVPAVEVMMNTRHVADLIERGDFGGIKEAMDKALAPDSQTFEQDLYRLYKDGVISLDDAMINADSPTNFSWLVNNAGAAPGQANTPIPAAASAMPEFDSEATDGALFSSFTLNMEDH